MHGSYSRTLFLIHTEPPTAGPTRVGRFFSRIGLHWLGAL